MPRRFAARHHAPSFPLRTGEQGTPGSPIRIGLQGCQDVGRGHGHVCRGSGVAKGYNDPGIQATTGGKSTPART